MADLELKDSICSYGGMAFSVCFSAHSIWARCVSLGQSCVGPHRHGTVRPTLALLRCVPITSAASHKQSRLESPRRTNLPPSATLCTFCLQGGIHECVVPRLACTWAALQDNMCSTHSMVSRWSVLRTTSLMSRWCRPVGLRLVQIAGRLCPRSTLLRRFGHSTAPIRAEGFGFPGDSVFCVHDERKEYSIVFRAVMNLPGHACGPYTPRVSVCVRRHCWIFIIVASSVLTMHACPCVSVKQFKSFHLANDTSCAPQTSGPLSCNRHQAGHIARAGHVDMQDAEIPSRERRQEQPWR